MSSKSKHEKIRNSIKSLANHQFLNNLEIRIVSYEQYEKSEHFSRSFRPRDLPVYNFVKNGPLRTTVGVIRRGENEFAVLVPPSSEREERGILHELGHIQVSETELAVELREALKSENPSASWFPPGVEWDYAYTLVERVVLLPEDMCIERIILDFPDVTARRRNLQFVCQEYEKGMSFAEEGDLAASQRIRVQSGLNRFFFSVASRALAEIACEYKFYDLEKELLRLSKSFASVSDFAGVPTHELWSLSSSPSRWVHDSLAALK